MNRNILALAVASVLAAPAFAQTSNVTLYGRANLGFDNYRAHGGQGGDLKSRNRIYDAASRLGVRGTEDLGNGLRAIFQIESGANIDTGSALGQGGQNNTSTGTLATRDSFVGLDGNFGRLTFGRQSIFWVNGTIIQTGANYVNAEVPFLNGASLGRVSGPSARTSNVVLYTTPSIGGFNASFGYSPTSEQAQVNQYTNGRIVGTTLRWAGGPFSAQGDWWRNTAPNQNIAGGSTSLAITGGSLPATALGGGSSLIDGKKVLFGYSYLPGAQISGVYGRNRNDASASFSGSNVRQDWWGISWEHTFGNIQGLAQFGRLMGVRNCGAGVDCTDTSAKSYLVGARYLMSKRTALYATYNVVHNGRNQFADYTGAGMTSAQPASTGSLLGADPKILAIGVIHNF